MLKKLVILVIAFIASAGFAFAQVDVNKADQAALDGIKGIGPKMSQRILDERKKGGNFKDWNDLQSRVKGIKEKSATKLSTAGLTVNGQPKNAAAAPVASGKPAPAAAAKIPPAKVGTPPANGAGKDAMKKSP